MDYGDSRNALFVEPNAYIQGFKPKTEAKKIVFQQPYECAPSFYMNNDFKKGNCNCVPKPKKPCNQKQPPCFNDCNQQPQQKSGLFDFDFKALLPILSLLTKGGEVDASNIASMLTSNKNSNPMGLISSLLANKDSFSNIFNILKGGGKTKDTEKEYLKSTDFEIKNYTKV